MLLAETMGALLFPETRDRQNAAVAHGGLDLGKRQSRVVAQGVRIGHIGIDAFFKRQFFVDAEFISLLIAHAGGNADAACHHVKLERACAASDNRFAPDL